MSVKLFPPNTQHVFLSRGLALHAAYVEYERTSARAHDSHVLVEIILLGCAMCHVPCAMHAPVTTATPFYHSRSSPTRFPPHLLSGPPSPFPTPTAHPHLTPGSVPLRPTSSLPSDLHLSSGSSLVPFSSPFITTDPFASVVPIADSPPVDLVTGPSLICLS